MAGRGRGATLPAWMTQQGSVPNGGSSDNLSNSNFSSGVSNNNGGSTRQFEDAPYNRNSGNVGRGESDNNVSDNRLQYDDRKRQRSRSPVRDEPRGSSGGGSGGWQPRAKRSNFDVAPPEGMSLPPVGVASTGGVPNSAMSHHSNNYSSGGSGGGGSYRSEGTNPQTRHARRIYAGGIPQKATETEILTFFNDVVTKALLPKRVDSPPVVKIYLNSEKSYAFVEFDSIELCTACLQLDGIKYEHPSQMTTIRVRRPNDYRPELLPPSGPIPVLNLSGILDDPSGKAPANFGPNKIFIGGLPYNLTDDQIMELLSAFGPIKNFHQVRDPGSATSKGYAFCEYFTPEVADAACQGLHGLQLGEKCLSVRIASTGANNATVAAATGSNSSGGGGGARHFSNYTGGNSGGNSGGYGNSGNDNYSSRNNYNSGNQDMGYNNSSYNDGYGSNNGGGYGQNSNNNNNNNYNGGGYNDRGGNSAGYNGGGYGQQQQHYPNQQQNLSIGGNIQSANPTRVLRLSNMLTPQDLQNDAEIADIREDVRLECVEHGRVIQVLIPRRKEGYSIEGLIYVEFQTPAMARSAAMVLNGRKFADSTVGVTYYDEQKFANGILN